MKERQLGVSEVTHEMKLLVTVEEAAVMLSIGRTAAWELVRSHTIRSVKIGRTRRVPVVAMRDYISQLLGSEVA